MGRPEPCVLFAQTFVHPQLDEHVDEVIFADPIVITACEFLEQNSSSASSAIALLGATSPPSFALEVFVQCEGESRFRRLCLPFLYSYSSSNVLEVEAVVTNHLVVRGSYRSLSLVIYGNTAEDLGQFNIEFDLDSSLANLVSSTEAKLEDLPPLLHTRNLAIEDSIFSLKTLPSLLPVADISIEMKTFLQLTFKLLDSQKLGDYIHKLIPIVASAASSFFNADLAKAGFSFRQYNVDGVHVDEQPMHVFIDARNNLLDNCRKFTEAGYMSADVLEECSSIETDLTTSKEFVDMLFYNFQFKEDAPHIGHPQVSQSENVILWLSLALLLCSGREGCFHFVNGGGMEQLTRLLENEMHKSSAITLMLLAVVEQATRYAVGCEGLLGWWPREDETVPGGTSEGYSRLLKLLMLKHRHDVASLATYVLHRLRIYEVASRYEHAVLSLLGRLSAAGTDATVASNVLSDARLQLRRILKLISSFGPVEDPSPVACVGRSLILAQAEEPLSYEVTTKLVASSSSWFRDREIDSKLLSLLNERGFLPLSLALLSSPNLRAGIGHNLDAFLDMKSSIEAIILSFLFCRSGLVFLLYHAELSSTVLHALKGASDMSKEDCVPLRYAFALVSKGFFCHAHEVGMIVEMHLRVVSAVDRLLTSSPHSEEFLWVLWELCRLSRSHCGHQALLALGHFPEAIQVLIEALHSAKESELLSLNSGTPLNLAIFHSAAEIFEAIVNDPISSSLGSWMEHAMDLHKALHSSSPGSNRKDAPTRLLEWIDAGVVYHKKGAIGLLHYGAVLASGGDAHMTATNILVADAIVVENAEGDPSGGPEVNAVESLLGKLVSDKSFDGVVLRDSSVAQLTTAFRVLALIAEIPEVASLLYDGSAATIVYVVLINCRLMFERFSNNYDYLVDDGTECNSTSDLLLERNREKCLIDLLIPSLVLLIELLQKLKEAKEQHRNTKLMKALLRLHLELSPKLATYAINLSTHPESVLGMEAVCHLVASALACWPVNAWDPGLFHTLLDSFHATSLLALGPKEACSLLCLLIDLLPEEGVLLWKNGVPSVTALRSLAVGTLLGPQKERQVNWYLQPDCVDVLLGQLMPHLDKISQVILHFTVSTLTVGQDMLRVLIIRIGCQQTEGACVLLRPILAWIQDHLLDPSSLDEADTYKAYKILGFLSCLLEHPLGKWLLLKEGALQILTKLLVRCVEDNWFQEPGSGKQIDRGFRLYSCCLPILKSISSLCNSHSGSRCVGINDRQLDVSAEDYVLIFLHVFKLCQSLPVGRELVACLEALKELISSAEGQRVLVDIFLHIQSSDAEETLSGVLKTGENSNIFNDIEWRKQPLLCCWITIYKSVEQNGPLSEAVEAVTVLCLAALRFGIDGRRFSDEKVAVLKYLLGISDDMTENDAIPEDNIAYIQDMFTLLSSQFADYESLATACTKAALHQAIESVKLLSLLLLKPSEADKVDDVISRGVTLLSSSESLSSRIHLLSDGRSQKVEDDYDIRELGDRFHWEYPENLRNRLSQAALPGKRKLSSDGASRHGRVDNSPAEVQSTFQRGSGPSVASSGPTRRDTFRQRKPNTSRPPSMHVDDYVARERNADVATNSNVIAVPRLGPSGGRPPSIHVDEFMARQRERQNNFAMAAVDVASQGKVVASGKEAVAEKSDRSRQLKVDLDDDLQGIDIVFDGEESEPDDKLPFPQPDDNLQHAGGAAAEQSPPRSIVEETDNDLNDMGVPPSSIDEKAQSEPSTRMSVSHPNMALRREPSISSDKKYLDQPDEFKSSNAVATPGGLDSYEVTRSSGFSASANNNLSAFSRMPSHNMYPPGNHRRGGSIPVMGSQGYADQKFLPSQPPLPPTPPPTTISSLRSQAPDPIAAPSSSFVNSMADMHPSFPHAYHAQMDPHSKYGSVSTSLNSASHMLDLRYPRTSQSFSGGSSRPLPPLPPTPPPFSAVGFSVPSQTSSSLSPAYHQSTAAANEFLPASTAFSSDNQFANLPSLGSRPPYHTNPLVPHSIFNRPPSASVSIHGNSPTQHQGDNLPSIALNLSTPQPSMHSVQPLTQLQPLQPPKLPFPRLPVHGSQSSEQGDSFLQSNQMQMQRQQSLQQSQTAQFQAYYRSQQQEDMSRSQLQARGQQSDGAQQQQQDSTLTLQQYFSSPEAIQSLLSDRDKLCQLLEQHPKLMQMLQERLGHL